MDYLTQYYKNLSEQLQYQINHVHQNLQEAYVLNPSQISSETIGTPHPFRQRKILFREVKEEQMY